MDIKIVKMAGIFCSVIGGLASVIASLCDDKKQSLKIAEEVAKQLSK